MPISSAERVSSILDSVELLPVPAMILALSPTASRTTLNRFSFSSIDNVGDSPVVPDITRLSEPVSTSNSASSPALS